MITLGIDLAGQPKGTAACLIDWGNERAQIQELIVGVDDMRLVAFFEKADRVGIDAPFGWPETFVTAVRAHHELQPWPDTTKEDLRYRRTDLLAKKKGSRVFSVSSDKIAVLSFRLASLFTRLRQDGIAIDRTGQGRFIEVYPAAALRAWGFESEGYKGKKGREMRRKIVESLEKRTGSWFRLEDPFRKRCLDSDDAFDAMIASFVTRAATLGLCELIPEGLLDAAQREGWIALPRPETLDSLA